MTDINEKKELEIRVSYDNMQAFLFLPTPVPEDYSEWDVEAQLQKSGIVHGVKKQAIQEAIRNHIYNKEILVAEGDYQKDGTAGYYEYKFNLDFSKKPKIHPDGTVDYWSIKMVETVSEGQVIAIYHNAVQGVDGCDIKGKPLIAKRARDLVPLRGKGFSRSEDGCIYTALLDGKIEMQNGRITILPVYEVAGDVDLSIGNIDFRGDVIIHGGVCTGVKIRAAGTLTIDGVVEGANIEAGKDIVLRSGVMGASRASITTRGNISAKFFEYARIHANGMIRADVFLNCRVSCEQDIVLDGARASIIGGEVWAIQGISAGTLGSDGEVKTVVRIGNSSAVTRRISILKNKVEVEKENLSKIEEGLRLLNDMVNDPRKSELLRVKIRDTALMADDTAELARLENQVERAKGGSIKVTGNAFPGVCVEIDDLRVQVREAQENLEFIKNLDKIVMCTLEYQ